jgi:hypothetical protein
MYIRMHIYTHTESEDDNVCGTGHAPLWAQNVLYVSFLHSCLGGSRFGIYWVVKVISLEHPRVKWRS